MKQILIFLLSVVAGGAFARAQVEGGGTNGTVLPGVFQGAELSVVDSKPIGALAFDPGGRCLAVAGGDHVIRLYNVITESRTNVSALRGFKGHSEPVQDVRFVGRNTLVSVAADGAKIWNVRSGKLLRSLPAGNGDFIAAISAGLKPILATAAARRVTLWDYETGARLYDFDANDSPVAALAFTPDGKFLVIGTFKGVVRVMDVASRQVRMIDLDAPIRSIAASSGRIAIGFADGGVALLNFGDEDSVPQKREQFAAIDRLAFSWNGERFASVSADGSVAVWDTASFKATGFYRFKNAAGPIAFSPDGRELAIAASNGEVTCWRLAPK